MKRLIFSLVGVLSLSSGCSQPTTDSDTSPRAVETFEVRSGAERSAPVYAGTLRAAQRSDLSFLRAGQIIEVRKELGESFSRGEILARLDNTELSLAVDELTANLTGALAERADAQLAHDRLLALDGTGAVSRADIDAATARLDTATSRVRSIEASIGQAQKRLAETVLHAPYEGQIIERLVEPSQTAVAGQAVYRVIGDDGGMEAIVNLPVTALELFAEGRQTELVVRPSGAARRATVTEVGNAAGLSGLYPVTLALADASGLRPGLRIEVPGRREDVSNRAPSIPLTAYIAVPGGSAIVLIVDSGTGVVSARNVEVGEITDEGIEVLTGLQPGDLIVARGLPSLRDGEIVTPLGVGVRQFNE